MSELNPLIEHAKCSLCNNYLSGPNIFLLPDGDSVCKGCSTVNKRYEPYRQFRLEKIFGNVLFPCQNDGCKETYKYGKRSKHDKICLFKEIKCFNCDWKGPLSIFKDHVKDHPSIIQESATFDVKLNCAEQRAFIVSNNDIFYLFNYKYESSNFSLTINITYYTSTEEKQFCKVQLTNTCDTDFTMEFKQSISVQHYDGLVNEHFGECIDLGPFIPTLNNPESLTIFVSADSIQKRKNEDVVNYEILDANRCDRCKYYLISPIFETAHGLICNICHYCTRRQIISGNSEKSLFLEKQNYPCRWNNCNQITKGNLIGDHEIMCPHRIYLCFFVICIKAGFAGLLHFDFKQHLTKNHKYFEQEIEQKILQNDAEICVCTAVNLEFEYIKISYYSQRFVIICHTTSNIDKINTRIKFKHSHCRAVSKTFTLIAKKDYKNYVPLSDLPMCFKKNKEIIAVITAF